MPEGLQKTLLLNTGSESNEAALRMAKLYTGGFEVIGYTGSWHGMTAGSQAHTYSYTRSGYGPVVPGSLAIPAPYGLSLSDQALSGNLRQLLFRSWY